MSGRMALFRTGLRLLVYLLFTAAILTALYLIPQSAPAVLAVAGLGGFVVALAHLRHTGLALAAALAPFPGILWFGNSAYALVIAFCLLSVSAYADALLKGQDAPTALAKPFPALTGTLGFAILWSLHIAVQLQSLLAASAAAFLFLPALVLTQQFDEDAVVRGNRRREKALRFFSFAARIAEPRWSYALTGAGLILAVLGFFQIVRQPPLFDWLAAPVAGALVLVLTRDGRGAVAATAAAALVLLFTGGVGGALLLFLLFALNLGRAAAFWRRLRESETLAWTRAIEDHSAAILFAGLAAMITAVPRGGPSAALHAGIGLVAALILYPAFSGVLHALLPRRRNLEELYRTSAS
jgi:hypothetical protein